MVVKMAFARTIFSRVSSLSGMRVVLLMISKDLSYRLRAIKIASRHPTISSTKNMTNFPTLKALTQLLIQGQ